MNWRPEALPPNVLGFLRDRHLATLTTLRDGGSPHVVPVGFTFDPDTATARVITFAASVKAANAALGGDERAVRTNDTSDAGAPRPHRGRDDAPDRAGLVGRGLRRAALCQVDGRRWVTLEGTVRLVDDPAVIDATVAAYAVRYRQPGQRTDRVVIEIAVDRVMGRC